MFFSRSILVKLLCLLTIGLYAQVPQINVAGSDDRWDGRFRQPGAGVETIYTLYADTNFIYAAGAFSYFGGNTNIRSFARFDGEKWEPIGGGFNCTSCGFGQQYDIVRDAQGRFYVGGFFEGARNPNGTDVLSSSVIRWDPALDQWESLGGGLNGTVRALAIDGDTLYAGGRISEAYNLSDTFAVENLARYIISTNTWEAIPDGGIGSTLGTPQQGFGDVEALAVGTSHELYVGGRFVDQAGGQQVYSVAQWAAGQGWSDMDGGLPFIIENVGFENDTSAANVFALRVDPRDGRLYAGGNFGTRGSVQNSLAVWDGTSWSILPFMQGRLGLGGNQVFALHIDTTNDRLMVGGQFGESNLPSGATESVGNGIAIRDLSSGTWSTWQDGFDGPWPRAIATWRGETYIGGGMSSVNDTLVIRKLVKWTGTEYDPLGEGLNFGLNIKALVEIGDTIIVGGSFSNLGGIEADALAMWDPVSGWRELGGGIKRGTVPGIVNVLKKCGDTLYVGGFFDQLGDGTTTDNLAAIRLSTGEWISWGGGVIGSSNAVTSIETFQNELVIGGAFTEVNGVPARNLARLSGGVWSELGGSNQVIDALENSGDTLLLIGGFFSEIADSSFSGIATWDGTEWGTLGNGLPAFRRVFAIADDSVTGRFYLGGNFSSVVQPDGSSLALQGLAAWDGQQWLNPGKGDLGRGGAGGNPSVAALDVGPEGDVYLAGDFATADTLVVNRLARLAPDGTWGALGSGIQPDESLQSSGNPDLQGVRVGPTYLWVWGDFTAAGDKQASALARYEIDEFATCSDPVAEFSFSAGSLLQLQFQDQSRGREINSWNWDFGDGNTASEQNPDHTYSDSGSYVVKLEIVDACGTDSYTDTVSVVCPALGVEITVDQDRLEASFGLLGSDTSIQSVLWEFGDGNTSSERAPVHQYQEAGDYLVSLQATTACGTDTLQREITVTCPLPIAEFSANVSDLEVTFEIAGADTTITGVFWDFGTGDTATVSNPTYVFPAPGNYEVTLVLSNECGKDTLSLEVVIAVTDVLRLSDAQVRIFPNPVSEWVRVQADRLSGSRLEISLRNANGQEVFRGQFPVEGGKVNREIPMAGLAPGIYYLQMISEGRHYQQKLVKY